jgi:hypothetical protein
MRAVTIAAFAAVGFGCGCHATAETPKNLREERLVKLREIASKCRLPAATLKLVGTDELHFQLRPDEKFERVECVLTELQKAKMSLNMGFVGNEAYDRNVQ